MTQDKTQDKTQDTTPKHDNTRQDKMQQTRCRHTVSSVLGGEGGGVRVLWLGVLLLLSKGMNEKTRD